VIPYVNGEVTGVIRTYSDVGEPTAQFRVVDGVLLQETLFLIAGHPTVTMHTPPTARIDKHLIDF